MYYYVGYALNVTTVIYEVTQFELRICYPQMNNVAIAFNQLARPDKRAQKNQGVVKIFNIQFIHRAFNVQALAYIHNRI